MKLKFFKKLIITLCVASISAATYSSSVGAITLLDQGKLNKEQMEYINGLNDCLNKTKKVLSKCEDLIELRTGEKQLEDERRLKFEQLLKEKEDKKQKINDAVKKMQKEIESSTLPFDMWSKRVAKFNSKIKLWGFEATVKPNLLLSDKAGRIELTDNGEPEVYLNVETSSEQKHFLKELQVSIKKMQDAVDLLDKQRLVEIKRMISIDDYVLDAICKNIEGIIRNIKGSNLTSDGISLMSEFINDRCVSIDRIINGKCFVFENKKNKNDIVDKKLEEQERVEREYSNVIKSFWDKRNEFIKWRNDNKYCLAQDRYKKDTTKNRRRWLDKNMLPLSNNNKLSVNEMKKYIDCAKHSIDEMEKFRNSYNAKRCDVVLGLISSLEKDIQKTEEEKNKYVKEIDSKIKNMENEILNLKFLIENAFDNGLDDAQINGLLDANDQKQKELLGLQKQRSNRVAEYNKKIKANNNKLKLLNSELNELFN